MREHSGSSSVGTIYGLRLRWRGTLPSPPLAAAGARAKNAVVPRSFRSSFRDRTVDNTNHPYRVAEAELVCVVRTEVEAAYRRSDLWVLQQSRQHHVPEWQLQGRV